MAGMTNTDKIGAVGHHCRQRLIGNAPSASQNERGHETDPGSDGDGLQGIAAHSSQYLIVLKLCSIGDFPPGSRN